MTGAGAGALEFRYTFEFPDETSVSFRIHLAPETLELEIPPDQDRPSWTRLEHHKCPNCPLKEATSPHCPVAVSLVPLVEALGPHASYERVRVTIETPERTYIKTVPAQVATSSLVGIHMVTSGCPHLDKLRPMVRNHLPFATSTETTYRFLSMYLLAQFYRRRHGLEPDWHLSHLVEILGNISTVNAHFIRRLRGVVPNDASLNALIRLDSVAGITRFAIVEEEYAEIEKLFAPYFEEPAPGGD